MRFSVSPLLLFLFAIFSAKTTCEKNPNDDWQTIFSEASQWNRNWPQTRVVFDIRQDSFGFSHRASIYRRNSNSSQTKNRVLFVDFDGLTWIYSPKTASWTRLSTSDINTDLTASRRYFSQLTANSITNLCGTRVISFAGARGAYHGLETSNETWLFSGANEKWTAITFATEVPRARFGHKAFSHYSTKSPCQCKESVIILGGKDVKRNFLHDFWELQCVDDRIETSMKYRWIEFTTNLGPLKEHKLNRLNPFSVNNTHIYWLIDGNQSAWIFDVETERWSSALINTVCPNEKTITMLGSTRVAGKYVKNAETLGRVYERQHRLLIFLLSTRWMGVYIVEKNRLQYVNVTIYDILPTSPFAKLMILENKLLILSFISETDHGITLWEVEIKHLLKAVHSNCSGSILKFRRIAFAERYPRLQWDSKLISITDTVWYLMQESQQKVQMWRLELDSLMWTLYDPDQVPGINPGLIESSQTCNVTLVSNELSVRIEKCYEGARFEAAFTATKSNNVAFFGSCLGFNPHGIDNLWIYTLNVRHWSMVEYDGTAPKKLTSYATMNSMSIESLLLFGGINNQTSSLWMITIDVQRMKAKWEKLCCHENQQMQLPLNKLQQWSSTIWNNTVYVYFGVIAASNHSPPTWKAISLNDTLFWFFANYRSDSCDWNTYYTTTLVTGDSTWHKAPMPPRQSCGQWQANQADGRFAFAQDEWHFYVADLSETNWITKPKKPLSFSHKYLLVGRESTLYTIRTLFDRTLPAALRIVSIESFKFPQCKPGKYSPNYILYPCRSCPKGQYNDKYGSTNCTECPNGFVTKATGSNSIKNCTCAPNTCIYGTCIIQTGYTTVCICNAGFTGKACEAPTMYLIGIGIVVALLLVGAFYYCVKRVRKHQKLAEYTRLELEMAEETVAQLSNIWSVDDDEVELKRMIGQGSFGDVWTARYRDQTVAIKILKIKAEDCTDEQLQEFKDESDLLRSIFHGNIVRFIGTGKTVDNKPFIVLEYMERGSMRNELNTNYSHRPMEYELQVKYALHAAKGMRHLHRIDRMHRDLKCDNLLINDKGTVKVADLGCTKMAPKITVSDDGNASVRGSRAVGTSLFRAPEMLRGEFYNVSVDVYSYGITLWEIATAKYPYFEKFTQGLMMAEILDEIVQRDARPEFPAVCLEDLKKLAESCWKGNPHERPTFEEIVPMLEKISLSICPDLIE